MKKMMTLILMLTALTTFAREFGDLREIHSDFNRQYSHLGSDNNYLESIFWNHDDIALIMEENPYANIKELNQSSYFNTVKKCIFMRKGAYLNHLNNSQQNNLTRTFLKRLDNDFIIYPALYLISNVQMEMVNNKCAILVIDRLNHESILIQGVSFD